jgi:hypothetical protein
VAFALAATDRRRIKAEAISERDLFITKDSQIGGWV